MTAYTTAQLTTFSLTSEFFSGQLPLDAPRLLATLPAALLAGFVASIASQPGDTLQTCTSADGGAEDCPVDPSSSESLSGPPSALDLALKLGWSGLFTGWEARLLQMEVIVVTQLQVYDAVKHEVGL
ncbi:unnamed protein product [Polarella glacialis]|uniref:Uncharacterized protein n=1 Tax=Polarella glacialis TaxID=89957 RepID=A0A813DMN9_POLGL|nr:unnamed protein product [Polarella glacialis]CAE8706353.1 unnamed protein product [Polarella glacialis]